MGTIMREGKSQIYKINLGKQKHKMFGKKYKQSIELNNYFLTHLKRTFIALTHSIRASAANANVRPAQFEINRRAAVMLVRGGNSKLNSKNINLFEFVPMEWPHLKLVAVFSSTTLTCWTMRPQRTVAQLASDASPMEAQTLDIVAEFDVHMGSRI
jgi:hypothetical protein